MIVVQIGANRGYDDLTSMISDMHLDKLLLIEPISKFNESLLRCYKHIENLHIENVAVTDDETQKSIILYLHKNMDEYTEQASLLDSHIHKHWPNSDRSEYIETEVKCVTINKLMEKHNIKEVDILYIDAEGFDDRIIKSIDFETFDIKKIYFENIHIDLNSLSEFLSTKGFKTIYGRQDPWCQVVNNSIAIKEN